MLPAEPDNLQARRLIQLSVKLQFLAAVQSTSRIVSTDVTMQLMTESVAR